MDTLLIKNGRIFDGHDFSHNDIFICDGIVQEIAPNLNHQARFTFDAANMTVLPGLVDVHMHMIAISGPQWGASTDGSCFPFGVTAAADASAGYGNQSILESFSVKSVAFVHCGVNRPIDFDALEEKVRRYGDKAVGIKLFYDGIGSPQLHDTIVLKEACDWAHQRNLSVTVHTSNCPVPMAELLSVLGKGDIATHIYHGNGHTVEEDNFQCLVDAKNRGVLLDVGFAGTGHVDFSIFRKALAAGITPDLLGTDLVRQVAFTRGGRYGQTMCMSIAKHLGMDEQDIFTAVTSRAAKALKHPWGILQEGGCADIAVLSYCSEPFDLTDKSGCRVHSDLGYRCMLTVSNGNVVYRAPNA